jgi:hypothetical protein
MLLEQQGCQAKLSSDQVDQKTDLPKVYRLSLCLCQTDGYVITQTRTLKTTEAAKVEVSKIEFTAVG